MADSVSAMLPVPRVLLRFWASKNYLILRPTSAALGLKIGVLGTESELRYQFLVMCQ